MMYFQERSAFSAMKSISESKTAVIDSLDRATKKQSEIFESASNPAYTEEDLTRDTREFEDISKSIEESFISYIDTLRASADSARLQTNVWIKTSVGCKEFVNDGSPSSC